MPALDSWVKNNDKLFLSPGGGNRGHFELPPVVRLQHLSDVLNRIVCFLIRFEPRSAAIDTCNNAFSEHRPIRCLSATDHVSQLRSAGDVSICFVIRCDSDTNQLRQQIALPPISTFAPPSLFR